jgi:hypothetical protein
MPQTLRWAGRDPASGNNTTKRAQKKITAAAGFAKLEDESIS